MEKLEQLFIFPKMVFRPNDFTIRWKLKIVERLGRKKSFEKWEKEKREGNERVEREKLFISLMDISNNV